MFPYLDREKSQNNKQSSSQFQQRNNDHKNNQQHQNRQLRLHLSQDGKQLASWSFDPSVARVSCHERILSYEKVYNYCQSARMKQIIL